MLPRNCLEEKLTNSFNEEDNRDWKLYGSFLSQELLDAIALRVANYASEIPYLSGQGHTIQSDGAELLLSNRADLHNNRRGFLCGVVNSLQHLDRRGCLFLRSPANRAGYFHPASGG